MNSLTIYTECRQGRSGVSLRGSCLNAAQVEQLEQALARLQQVTTDCIWLDCRHLKALSYLGQRSLLWSDARARAAGIMLYWCGLPESVLAKLRESGLDLLLNLMPAAAYQGPEELLDRAIAPVPFA